MMKTVFAVAAVLIAVVAQAQGLLSSRGLRRGANRQMGAPSAPAARTQPAPAARAAGTDAAASATIGSEPGGRSIEFNATPVDLVFTVYGELVGKTVLKDPQVPAATITLQPRQGQELTDEDKIEAIETVLEMNGIHMESYGEKFVRALPRKTVRQEGIPLIMDPDHELSDSTRVVSLMLPFKNIAIEEAQKALEGFKSASGILLVFERTNAILITDTEANINRMREIAKSIDIASPVTEVVEYIQIKNANATEVKQVIDAIVQESQKEQEANGKKVNTPAQQQPQAPRPLVGSLLRRPGQQNQPAEPVNNASMFMSVSEADRGMIRGKVVTIADERSNKILIITSATNMKFFKQVIEALDVETTPDTVVKVYRLKYADAEDVSDMINDLIGNSSSSKNSGKANQNQNAKQGASGSVTRGTQQTAAAKKSVNQRSGEAKAGELSKDNTTVLADKRINGLVVMTDKELVPTIEQIIESMDIKLSQVLIETVIVEVGLGDDLKTGVDWLRLGDKKMVTSPKFDSDGVGIYRYTDGSGHIMESRDRGSSFELEGEDSSTTWTRLEQVMNVDWVRSGFLNNDDGMASMLGGGGGTGAGLLNSLAGVAAGAVSNASEGVSVLSPAGTGLNWFMKSDKLNLGAVIQASKTDNRTKYIASPIIMTLDNKEATIEATEMRYMFKGYQYSGSTYNGSAVPDYEQKELGITIKVTPKINPNGTVMLTIEEEYSQEGAGQKITASDGKSDISAATTITRKMSADALLENNQTVIFGGLTQTVKKEAESGIPILKDIPWIGKWLFGTVSESESRSELLVFMTPYVLDDAKAAEAEAIRRKKTMSDPRPWEDHGWSLSKLADPVSKKEQMRRIQDEWKKQDEERQTKLAIEKAKLDRAKKLKELSKEERDLWLKMHKEELDDEQQEELEKKMLDKDSQDALKKLAEEIREKKLVAAEQELKQAEALTAAENERAKLDAEKKKAAAETDAAEAAK